MKIAHLHVWDTKNKGDVAIVHAVQDLLRQTFAESSVVDFPIDILKSGSKADLKNINKCDLVIIGGGGIYCRYFLPFNKKIIQAIKSPIIIFGVGFGNEIGSEALPNEMLESIVFLNNKAMLASVRDVRSVNILKKAGYKGNLQLIGDPAVVLNESPTDLQKPERSVGININYSGWLEFGKYREKILSSYRECIDNLQSEYGADIYYLVHHPDEYEIVKQLERDVKIWDFPAKEQKSAYAKLDLAICMMLHSAILNFGAGTPLVNVAYDAKNLAFAEFIGHNELAVHPNELEPGVLWQKTKHVMENSDYYREKFAQKKTEISQGINQFLNQIEYLAN